jgi:hypothetical protein
VKTAEGDEYGPVTRAELDQWVTEERIDTECQILQEGWDQWQWAEEVLPQLTGAEPEATEESPFAGIGDSSPAVGAAEEENPFAGIGDSSPAVAAAEEESPFAGIGDSSPGVAVETGLPETGEANAFASPTSEEFEAAEPGGVVSPAIVDSMEGTRPWALFCSILAFVASGFYALFAMLSLLGIRQSMVGTMVMFVMIGACASIFGFIGYLLLTYSKEAGAFVRSRDVAALEKALESQRSFWKTMGILASVLIAIMILMVIALFIFGIFAATAVASAG